MKRIRDAQQAIEHAHKQLDDAVADARESGSTWAEIGAALGMSRQAAFKRFGRPKNPTTGAVMAARSTDHLPELAEQFFTLVSKGDETGVMGMLHHRVRKELPWSDIIDLWTQVVTELGELEGFSDTFVTTPKGTRPEGGILGKIGGKILGYAVAVTTVNFEAGEMMGRVAFDNDDAIVGILILPTDAEEFSF